MPEEKLKVLCDEIAVRIPHEDFITRLRTIEKIQNFIEKGFFSPNLLQALYDFYLN